MQWKTNTAMQEHLLPFVALLNEMSPYLLLGFLIAGILHAFVPGRFYARYLARNDARSAALAALFGVPLPLCSCGVIPTAMAMRREGASRAAVVSFLIATPQTGVNSILATAGLLGLPFALIRPAAAFVTALAGGTLAARLLPDADRSAAAQGCDLRPRSFAGKIRAVFSYGFGEMMQDIGRWLVIGLLLAGAITIFVPNDFFAVSGAHPLAGMLLVLALSIPMYLCATGSVPVAAALMLKGLSPGAALVLLMAGPATNIASMLVIGKVLGRKTLLLYLAAIIAGAVGFGLAIDTLLPAAWFQPRAGAFCAGHCADAGLSWWKTASSVLFLLLLAAALVRRFRKSSKNRPMENTFKIEGMMCNHCKANVERTLASVEGVTSVEVDLAAGTARIEGVYDPRQIVTAVQELGYGCSE